MNIFSQWVRGVLASLVFLPASGVFGQEEGAPGNELIGEKSPYLLQHAHNPVNWYPWGEKAFAKARAEEKPILLSIGYSTCHWCHVMERESFTDEGVAAYLNEHFISIKLDREERPDIDAVYMTCFQAMMGQGGGWPLNVFLTPERKLFYGGTYFPPKSAQGRPSFQKVLEGVSQAWKEDRAGVLKSAEGLAAQLNLHLQSERGRAGELDEGVVARAVAELAAKVDPANGGWDGGPKFPQPSRLILLLTSEDPAARERGLFTCRKMAAGGIHDRLGGGFHRYATDERWLVPHFEKMLYDQSQLLEVYCEAWRLSREEVFREAACGIADYVIEELQHPEGGYWSAQDAQSEGKEGKYWCWTLAELRELLEASELTVVTRVFGLSEKGNFFDFSDPEALRHQNVLSLVGEVGEDGAVLAKAIARMKAERAKRVPPMTDDKILAGWNGLMIAAMAGAGRVFEQPRYLASAQRAFADVGDKLWDGKRLGNRWREGDVEGSQLAMNYLAMAKAGRILYAATLQEEFLVQGLAYLDGARERFFATGEGGFYDGGAETALLMRLRDDYDSAMPTASSLGAQELVLYGEMTGRADLMQDAELTFQHFGKTLREAPLSLPAMMRALHWSLAKPARLVIAGDGEKVAQFLKVAWRATGGDLLVMGTRGPVSDFTKTLQSDGEVQAFYCEGMTCREPTADPAKIALIFQQEGSKEEAPDDE